MRAAEQTEGLDPFFLARRLGIHMHPRARSGAALRGVHLYYDGRLPLERQRALISKHAIAFAGKQLACACRGPRKAHPAASRQHVA